MISFILRCFEVAALNKNLKSIFCQRMVPIYCNRGQTHCEEATLVVCTVPTAAPQLHSFQMVQPSKAEVMLPFHSLGLNTKIYFDIHIIFCTKIATIYSHFTDLLFLSSLPSLKGNLSLSLGKTRKIAKPD